MIVLKHTLSCNSTELSRIMENLHGILRVEVGRGMQVFKKIQKNTFL